MKFIDEATIEVIAGDGGRGCVGFRREKYVPRGGPDGGDGGRGGHVIFCTDEGLTTLMDIRYRRKIEVKHGGHGKGKQMNGRSSDDIIVRVPVGTVVSDADTDEILADLDRFPQEWIAAKGGRGGLGNMHFATSVNQAPRKAQPGEPGEKRHLRLELKLLADVGIIGLPNAGKSTLISTVSNSRPKIADYPFTTKVPNLGVVALSDGKSCVMADIPGLIEGASGGAGLGLQFLRHIERTRLLVHLIDPIDPASPDPVQSYDVIRHELGAYNHALLEKPEIICLTKMDIPEAHEQAVRLKKKFAKKTSSPVLQISAATRKGIKELLHAIEIKYVPVTEKGRSL
ncbi:MAG: GTPase ObgE [Deltaproteobacteria bacterium]|nr:GTPase ObgE [Deltaproteobacteria bacterium]